jgi:hypothetical protein
LDSIGNTQEGLNAVEIITSTIRRAGAAILFRETKLD